MQAHFPLILKDGYIWLVAITNLGLFVEIAIQLRKRGPLGITIGLLFIVLSGTLFILHRLTGSGIALIGTYAVSFLGVTLIVYSGYQDAKRREHRRAVDMKKIIIGWVVFLMACAITLVVVYIGKEMSGT